MPSYITGKTTCSLGAWGAYRVREIDFGETVNSVIDVTGNDATDVREYTAGDFADLAEVRVTIVFDSSVATDLPPFFTTGSKTLASATFTLADSSTIVGNAIGVASSWGVHTFNREILASFRFKWSSAPVHTVAP